jgi:hypothetical protein
MQSALRMFSMDNPLMVAFDVMCVFGNRAARGGRLMSPPQLALHAARSRKRASVHAFRRCQRAIDRTGSTNICDALHDSWHCRQAMRAES